MAHDGIKFSWALAVFGTECEVRFIPSYGSRRTQIVFPLYETLANNNVEQSDKTGSTLFHSILDRLLMKSLKVSIGHSWTSYLLQIGRH
jgi:hypothetical protein